ncbi:MULTISPECIES: hypothetical protein [Hyphobacterium]|uniref:Secreted protein n=1 Tax=Hyphobacterium vulgare TaxID=1736751 RepID=A0ABV6ZT77_9PROT
MKYASLAATILSTALLAACNDGPAENAGEDVDEAVEDVTGEDTDTFEEAGENVDETTDDEPGRR